jgi:hypothetical protein
MKLTKSIFAVIAIVILLITIQCDFNRKGNINKYYDNPYPEDKLSMFIQLPVGTVQPEGWIRKELQAWAEGITGHLHEYKENVFWNTWDDRKFRSERAKKEKGKWWSYEQQAYWADGLFQLAYILNDERLKKISDDFVDKVLAGQKEDGYFAGWPDDPYSNDGEIYTLSLISQALISYYSATGDGRIIPALQKAFRHIYINCKPVPDSAGLLPVAWHGGSYGWPSATHIIYPVLQVYSRTGDRELFDLAELIYKTGQEITFVGRNGRRSDLQIKNLLLSGNTFYDMHGVDATEVLRIPAIRYLYSGNQDDLNASIRGHDKIERYSDQAHGAPSSDEQLREPGATISTEMCTQSTWSSTRQTMFAITGNVNYADGVEKIVFNIGPGSRKPGGKAIQYYSAPNQVACTDNSNRAPLTLPRRHSFNPDADPTTPCCIGQSNRLYPNFVKDAMWLASLDNGLAAACYGPSRVSAKVGKNGEIITIMEKTNYPFEDKIIFNFTSAKPVEFPLYLRIPGWCSEASIKINGQTYKDDLIPGKMVRIERIWNTDDSVELNLPLKINLSVWNNSSVAVERGPLVYSLKIKQNWEMIGERFPGFPDWKCLPASDWNYALCFFLEVHGPKKFPLISTIYPTESYFTVKYNDVPEDSYPWEYPPIEITCKGKKVDNWKLLEDDVTPDVPPGPVLNNNPEEDITLIPFGCAPIRITYFPVAEKQK